jgi:hypothetical protein
MRINGIEAFFFKENKKIFFQFSQKNNNFFVIQDEKNTLDLLIDAIKTLLSKDLRSHFFSKIIFYMMDHLSNQWVVQIDSKSKSLQISKNNTKYTCDGHVNTFLEMIWDLGAYPHFELEEIPTYKIQIKNDLIDILSEGEVGLNQTLWDFEKRDQTDLEALWSKTTGNPVSFQQIKENAESLYLLGMEYKSLARRYQSFQFPKEEPTLNLNYLSSLKSQIDVMGEMESKLKDLEVLFDTAPHLDEKIKFLDEKISSFSSQNWDPSDWTKITEDFFGKERGINETKILQAISASIHNHIVPLFKDIEEKIIQYETNQNSKWLPMFQSSKSEEEANQFKKMINYKDHILKTLSQLEEERKNIQKDSQLKWQRTAGSKKLPLEANLEELASRFRDQIDGLSFLLEREKVQLEKKQMDDKIDEFSTILKKWQSVTGSQKVLSFDNPGALLVEARNICRYKKEKEQSYEYLEKHFTQTVQRQTRKQLLEAQASEIQKKWKSIWEKFNGSTPKIQEAIPLLQRALHLSHVENFLSINIKKTNPFKKETPVHPFILWKIDQPDHTFLSKDGLEDLTQFFFAHGDHPGIHIFLDEGEDRKNTLEQMGFGRIVGKLSSLEEKAQAKQEDSLPQKTKDLLKILNGNF